MFKNLFSTVGILAVLMIALGMFVDVRNFDRTKGGYEYPFEGWSGQTINFTDMYQTNEGLFTRGYVIDLYFNCKTGFITWKILGLLSGEFRKMSERAIVVHKPQDECKARGFDPNSWAISDLL